MNQPVFVICGGRTGGTMLADILSRLPGMCLYIEPFHPEIPSLAATNPKGTSPKMGHTTLVPHPHRAYAALQRDRLQLLHTLARSSTGGKRAYLEYLVEEAPGRPIIKVCRMNGQRHLLREWFPESTIIYLERDENWQRASMLKVGLELNYFGIMSGHGVSTFRDGWVASHAEGMEVADYMLTYGALTSAPMSYLRECAAAMGCDQDDVRELAGLVQPR